MVFSLLGNIRIGDATWTGPNAAKETRRASLPELPVARGKPVVQDTGDELDTKQLDFFFDETFCEPNAELAKLEAAFANRSPLPYVGGDGAFAGVRWLIEEVSVETLKTTIGGRPVRIKVSARLTKVRRTVLHEDGALYLAVGPARLKISKAGIVSSVPITQGAVVLPGRRS